VVWVGNQPPIESESQWLWQILDGWRASKYQIGLQDLELFLQGNTNSPWAPSLHANLGKFYLDQGRITPALEHWEAALELTANEPVGNGKKVADFTLAHWTRLLASLGRVEILEAILQETEGRVLDYGPLSQKWARTREAFAEMLKYPGLSYKCGTYAVDQVAKALQRQFDSRYLLSVPSPATGFSMKTLADLSAQLGLGLVAVARGGDSRLVVPSVIHWEQGHYGAVGSRQGQLYKVVDPTFGRVQFLTDEAINSEASGFFMVAANQVPPGWRLLSSGETSLIYGRGNPNFLGDIDDQQCPDSCECPAGMGGGGGGGNGTGSGGNGRIGAGAPSSCTNCRGLSVWQISEPWVNIWLLDEPLGYQPALGPRVSFTLYYKQRDELADTSFNFSSVGLNWNCSWLSYIYSPYGPAYPEVNLPGGGRSYFYDSAQTPTNYYNNMRLRLLTTNSVGVATSYELLHPDGAKDVYGFVPTNIYGDSIARCFLTQKVDPQGLATSLVYESYDPDELIIRLKYVVDPDGRTNTIYHASSGYSTNLITQVVDPFGRTTTLQYDANGQLTNITDVANMSSSMTYDDYGWPSSMTTPYGTTYFAPVDKGMTIQYNIDRYVTITEPAGAKQLYAFVQFPPYEPETYSPVPTNTPIGTLDTDLYEGPGSRNSYHWNRQQYVALSTTNIDNFTANDYIKARMRHWLGYTVHYEARKVDTLSVQREPSADGVNGGQLTWFDYTNKGGYGSGDQGDQILPAVIARVLPDGSTWFTWYQRNGWGIPTNVVETYTRTDGSIGWRTNSFGYASNWVDLLTETNASGFQVSSNYYNAYHQVLTNYNALNETTIYTYDANRQLTSIRRPSGLTTTNLYFTGGTSANRLDQTIDVQINRSNSYTYLSNGLVQTHTDERGLARTFTY